MYLFKSKGDILSFSTLNAFYAFLISAFLFTNLLIALPQENSFFSANPNTLAPGLSIFISTPLLLALTTGLFWLFNIDTKQATQDLDKYNPTKTTKTYISFSITILIVHTFLFRNVPISGLWHLGFLSLTLISIFLSIKTSQKIYASLILTPVQMIVSISDEELQKLLNQQNVQTNSSLNLNAPPLDEHEIEETNITTLFKKICYPIAKSEWKINGFAKHKYGFLMECINYEPALLPPINGDEVDTELFNLYLELDDLEIKFKQSNINEHDAEIKLNYLTNRINLIKNNELNIENNLERANSTKTEAGYFIDNNQNGAKNNSAIITDDEHSNKTTIPNQSNKNTNPLPNPDNDIANVSNENNQSFQEKKEQAIDTTTIDEEQPRKKTLPHKFHIYLGWHRGHSLTLLFSVEALPTPKQFANLIKLNNPNFDVQINEC